MKRGNYDSYLSYAFDVLKRKWKRMSREKKIAICYGTLALIIGLCVGAKLGGSIEKQNAEKRLVETTAELEKEKKEQVEKLQKELDKALKSEEADTSEEGEEKELPWYLVLVNNKNPMADDYQIPELKELANDYSVDSRIWEAANQMLSDAKAAGLDVVLCSAYRSVSRQEELFIASLKDRLKSGLNYWDAFVDTRMSVAEPGTSEHALGLALDLISKHYMELDEKQRETAEAKWLEANCYKYGFILRYPPEKTDITGIIYEPWHYRYVGVEHATKITELGVTLEEYLEFYY